MRTPGISKGLSLIFAGAMLSACSGVPVQLGPQGDEKYDVTKPRTVSAEACGFQLVIVIPIGINDRAARALAKLRQQGGEDYIADIKIQETWTYAVVGTVHCTYIEATAYPRGKT